MEKKIKEEVKTNEVLNSKQRTGIEKYLESRFFQYGVKWFQFEYKETPEYTFKALFSQKLPLNGLGIFRHALSSCTFEAKVWISKDSLPLICCHLSYHHITGGSNGCDVGVNLFVNSEGEVVENYTK